MGKKKLPTGTKEWAATSVNFTDGCQHNCHYCYAKSSAIRYGRNTADGWRHERIRQKAVDKNYGKKRNNAKNDVMTPTSHDVTPGNIDAAIIIFTKLLKAGNNILIVNKPTLFCVKRMVKELAEWKDQILFRFSIGSSDDEILKFWEPYAPNFAHRVKCLKHAFDAGYKVSVSGEPILDNNTIDMVEKVRPYVNDAIWIGPPNNLVAAVSLNTNKDETILEAAHELNSIMTKEYFEMLYTEYKDDTTIKWKDSAKKMLGLEQPTEKGLDI